MNTTTTEINAKMSAAHQYIDAFHRLQTAEQAHEAARANAEMLATQAAQAKDQRDVADANYAGTRVAEGTTNRAWCEAASAREQAKAAANLARHGLRSAAESGCPVTVWEVAAHCARLIEERERAIQTAATAEAFFLAANQSHCAAGAARTDAVRLAGRLSDQLRRANALLEQRKADLERAQASFEEATEAIIQAAATGN